MHSQAAYLFLEFAVLAAVLGLCYEHRRVRALLSGRFLLPALLLAGLWLVIDLLAVEMGLWWFPREGSLPVRILRLPIEEHVLFFLHTLVCFMLVEQYEEGE